MPAAGITSNLGAAAIWVWVTLNRPGYFLVKAGPTATRMEFGGRSIQWRITTAAKIRAFNKKVIVLPCKRHLGTFIDDDVFFFWGKFV